MEDVIFSLLMLIFFIGILYLPARAMLKVNKKIGYNYSVKFLNVSDVPELKDDAQLRKYLRVVTHSDNAYVVQSKWNDKKLREYLMTNYHLTKQQIVVQSVQASGPLGML
ncbi:hypothetical protein [Streptococcus pluranimalium]|uniref:Uncharacterized protein n=1 Tax=Streptococcus pluranimalium TaxID=82348 RepID=A0A2L0D371_9STRE|nr:hypothetical protein [Streptococcus pluranimalium]AUW96255.1 hypothetical protein C0J00_03545 [Streptococcus pluranimalium]